MARIRLEQILAPLKFSFAIASSGSLYVINSNSPITGSLEGNPVDGGSF